MTVYHYAVVEKLETALHEDNAAHADMENVDYKRQPDPAGLARTFRSLQGQVLGIWRGGLFGLATNQISVLSAWSDGRSPAETLSTGISSPDYFILDQAEYDRTVRPEQPAPVDRHGFYVIRWIRMRREDIAEYSALCLETWPAFERVAQCRCYNVFTSSGADDIQKILMLTWYRSLTDWEISRKLVPEDAAKWVRRSEMELSHWAEVARLAELAPAFATSVSPAMRTSPSQMR